MLIVIFCIDVMLYRLNLLLTVKFSTIRSNMLIMRILNTFKKTPE